jgi:hypothetical protein
MTVELPGIFTKLGLDTTTFVSGVTSAKSSLSDLARSTDAFTAVNNRFTEMGNSIKNSGLVSASQSAMSTLSSLGNSVSNFVIGKGLSALPAMMESAAKGATAAEADQLRLRQAVENTGTSWATAGAGIDAAAAKARSMGFAMGDVRSSLSNLVATTGNADEAQKRLGLAMDLSRGTGLDLTTASRLLGKVTDENVNVLARYGIHMEKGASSTELFAAIQQKFGGQAATFANSATGQMAQYQATMGQVTAQLGQAFLPILQLQAQFMASVMVPIVTTLVVPALKQIADWSKAIGAVVLNEFMPIWRDLVRLLVGDVADATGGVGTSLKGIGDTIGTYLRPAVDILRDSFKTIIQVFQGNWSPAPEINGVTNAIGIAATFVRDIAMPAISGLFTFISDNRQVIASVIAGFAAFAFLSTVAGWIAGVTAVVGPLIAGVTGIVAIISGGGGITAVLGALVAVLGGPVTVAFIAIGLLTAAWVNDWGGIQEKTKAVLDFIGPYISTALGAIEQFWTDHGTQILGAAQTAWDGIRQHISNVIRMIGDVFTIAIALFTGDWSGAWTALKDLASTFWDDLKLQFTTAFDALNTLTGGKLDGIKAAFTVAWPIITAIVTTAWDDLKAATDTAWGVASGIGGVLSSAWDDIKSALDAAWNAPGAIVATIGSAWDTVTSSTDTALNTAGTGIVALAASAWDAIKGGTTTAWTTAGGIVESIGSAWDSIKTSTTNALTAAPDAITTLVANGWATVKTGLDTVFGAGTGDTITGLIATAWENVKSNTKLLMEDPSAGIQQILSNDWGLVKTGLDTVFGAGTGDTITGIISTAWGNVQENTRLLMQDPVTGIKHLLENDWALVKTGLDTVFGKGTGDTITGLLTDGWNSFKSLTDTVFGAGQGARAVFESAMTALSSAMNPVKGLLDTIAGAIDHLKQIMPEWLIPHSPTPFEIGLRGIADAARSMSDAFSGIGGGTDLLKNIGAMATGLGGADFGRAAMSIMGAETEGGKYLHQIGGTGAVGPFMFDPGGELKNFAASLHVSVAEAARIAMAEPMKAAAWALQGYLGDAIRAGQGRGLTGRDLAIYGEKYGERPAEGLEVRAGEWYDRLFRAAGGGIFSSPTAVLLGEAGTEAVFNASQMNWLGRQLGQSSGGGRPIHVTVKLGSRTLADAWVEGRTEADLQGRA